jgi:hypothetical protein
MIAPGSGHGKSLILAINAAKRTKEALFDHEVVKSAHENAQIRTIARHAGAR